MSSDLYDDDADAFPDCSVCRFCHSAVRRVHEGQTLIYRCKHCKREARFYVPQFRHEPMPQPEPYELKGVLLDSKPPPMPSVPMPAIPRLVVASDIELRCNSKK